MGDSIRFDDAVEYYDRTRALPPDVQDAMVERVSAELRERGRVLEIGAGTGRIGLPLREAGVDVFGLDLSLPMLQRLLAKADGAAPVVQADATRLPFSDASFGAAYAVHVLHLIPQWREAVRELVRVVRPGGTILVSQGWWGVVAFVEVVEAFAGAAGMELRHVGLNEEAELDEALADASPRELLRVEGTQKQTLREMVDRLRAGLYSFTWSVDQAARDRGAEAATAVAEERYGSLDELRDMPQEMYWRAYDLPG
ncbi:MAG TPA: class I SAM-dependent methyltransferase [Actinomycetota bacterium]|nr:class I SAM-dependent methyltransferase [Actinomycetota bacterium]